MRVHIMLRLAGFVFLAFLPTGLAQGIAKVCEGDGDCYPGNCCQEDSHCSSRDTLSIIGGGVATDACECMSNVIKSDQSECVCNDDSHCAPDTCCQADGSCSSRKPMSVSAGDIANDACECDSGVYSIDTGRCGCVHDGDCRGSTCCRENSTCSRRAAGSVTGGSPATDSCECMTTVFDDDTNICSSWHMGMQIPKNIARILAGDAVEDEPDCVSLSYDFAPGRCECTEDSQCADVPGAICCPTTHICELDTPGQSSACGDPHMVGFHGQKFDFTGNDGAWYALVSDLPWMHLNMRVTAPVPSVPEITYITGISLLTTDDDGIDHTVVISVNQPHSMDSACPVEISPCLADGSLNVVLDGEEALVAPGTVTLAPGVYVAAVNIPGECRSFGFETYWEKKKEESAQGHRMLNEWIMDMGDWILADVTATNMVECTEYVARSMTEAGGVFAHSSEHASFQIVTPMATIRLSHGRLHQLPMRDPTDNFNLPDHLTWQMNLAIDHTDVSQDAQGILGETFVPTRDLDGHFIMHGMNAIRGAQEDCGHYWPSGTNSSSSQPNS